MFVIRLNPNPLRFDICAIQPSPAGKLRKGTYKASAVKQLLNGGENQPQKNKMWNPMKPIIMDLYDGIPSGNLLHSY